MKRQHKTQTVVLIRRAGFFFVPNLIERMPGLNPLRSHWWVETHINRVIHNTTQHQRSPSSERSSVHCRFICFYDSPAAASISGVLLMLFQLFNCYLQTVSGEDDASSCFRLRKSRHDFLGVLMWPPLLQERFSLVAVVLVKWGLEGPDLFVDCVIIHQTLHCTSGKYFRMISWRLFFLDLHYS